MPVVDFEHNRQQIIVPVAVVVPCGAGSHHVRLRGLIDTGASASGVPASVATDLDLPRGDKSVITTPAGEAVVRNHLFRLGFYLADAMLPYVLDANVLGIASVPGHDFDVLIGMDVLGSGELAIRRDGRGSFTFG